MPAPVNFPSVDAFFPTTEDGRDIHLKALAAAVRGIMDGRINAAFDLELEAGTATTTTIEDKRISDTSRIILVPMDAAAAAHHAAGTVRVTNVTTEAFTLTHLPSTLTRSFRASILS